MAFKRKALDYIQDMFRQHNMVKRTIISFVSVFLTGFAVSLFSLSKFGVDPFTSMNMNIASTLGIGFGTYQLIVNIVILFFVVVVAHRGLIGVGTVFNMIFVGYSCEFFEKHLENVFDTSLIQVRIALLIIGIVTMCLSASLFFTANVGVGPYDTLSFMISRVKDIKPKFTRIFTDISVILIGLIVSGGAYSIANGNFSDLKNIGIGTIITAFCMGPLINFFNKNVSSKVLDVDYAEIGKETLLFLVKGAMLKNNMTPVIGNETNTSQNAFEVATAAPFEIFE